MHTKLAYGLAVASAMGFSEVYSADLLRIRRDGAHAHAAPSSGYDTPSAGYGAPDTGYGAPDTGYAAPDTGYGAPDTGYGAPDTGYGAPATGYGAPEYGGNDVKLNLDFLHWLPAIALLFVGLSLLFPNVRDIDVKRKKRSVEGKSALENISPQMKHKQKPCKFHPPKHR